MSQHYLPLWGMKPTVLDQRNLLDLHTLILTHSGLLTRPDAALGAGQADTSPTRSASFRTEVKDVLILVANSRERIPPDLSALLRSNLSMTVVRCGSLEEHAMSLRAEEI